MNEQHLEDAIHMLIQGLQRTRTDLVKSEASAIVHLAIELARSEQQECSALSPTTEDFTHTHRCTEPAGHDGPHVDGFSGAVWHQ